MYDKFWCTYNFIYYSKFYDEEQVNTVNGQQTSVVVEQDMTIDAWHTIIMVCILILLVLQIAGMVYRLHRQSMKKKYLSRMEMLEKNGQRHVWFWSKTVLFNCELLSSEKFLLSVLVADRPLIWFNFFFLLFQLI